MMNSKDFVAALIDAAKNHKTLYVMGCFGAPMTAKAKERYTHNHPYNARNDRRACIEAADAETFGFDCVCLIKGILWGWAADLNDIYGGADYAVNGVPDIDADQMIKACTGVSSTGWDAMAPGEAVWLPGHIGVYIGDGLVVECSPRWANGVQITACGNITAKAGYNARAWEKHGRLPYVEYAAPAPKPTPKPQKSVDELAREVIAGKWGNGADRKERLKAAGYDYAAVQARVNELMKGDTQDAKGEQKKFIEKIGPMATEDMKKTGILASLTIAQAILESGWGKSGLTVAANNLFGIKGTYKGQGHTCKTQEWDGEKYVTVDATFRKYPSWAESLADHSDLFLRLDRYKNLRGLTDYKLACRYVKEDGYATSPTYTENLINLIETYHLTEWDVKAPAPKPAPKPTPKPQKSVDELAREVIAGKWGNGADRKERLKAAGYDYAAVQARVNELVKPQKSVDELAREVIAGKWGNGADRKQRLKAAGYDYAAVQARVNKLLS